MDREKVDLHIHTTASDGTDRPEEIVARVKEEGITLFSVTDHDTIIGPGGIKDLLTAGDPAFITGVEFSCKDEEGQYHLLGYGYDVNASSIKEITAAGHKLRMDKLRERLDVLREKFGVSFSEKDREKLFACNNPGKPHIAGLMVSRGYVRTEEEAYRDYLDKCRCKSAYIRPEDAVCAIIGSGGIPVLAHPPFGRGDQNFVGEEMDKRLEKLVSFGLQGVEGFYSGYSPESQAETLAFAEKYDLYVTAGSDYHGANKTVRLGETHLDAVPQYPRGLKAFLNAVSVFRP